MTETICVSIDFDRVCRCCASEYDFVADLFTATCSDSRTYCEVLSESMQLQIFRDDGLPSYVCYGCASNLESFSVFRNKCLESEYVLKEMFMNLQQLESELKCAGFFDAEFLDQTSPAEESEADEIDVFELFEEDVVTGLEEFRAMEEDRLDSDAYDEIEFGFEFDFEFDGPHEDVEKSENSKGFDEIWSEEWSDLDVLIDGFDPDELLENSIVFGEEYARVEQPVAVVEERPEPIEQEAVEAVQKKKKKQQRRRPTTERKKTTYECDACDRTFVQKFYLDVHRRIHTGERPFACELCGKSFRRKRSVDAHMRTHTGEKPFACEQCDKTFTQKYTLDVHRRTHTGEKPFACERCDKTFALKTNLDKHAKTHTGEKPFACEQCDKTFTRRRNLRLHARVHTGENSLACDRCDRTFTVRTSLDAHRRNDHTVGDETFACDACGRTFAIRAALAEHRKTHAGDKPFACDLCTKRYTAKSSLIDHRRIHGAARTYAPEDRITTTAADRV